MGNTPGATKGNKIPGQENTEDSVKLPPGESYAQSLKKLSAGEIDEGLKLLREAASEEHDGALLQLGKMTRDGIGTPVDIEEALSLFRKTKDQSGQIEIGLSYLKGKGVEKDHYQAQKYFKELSDKGNLEATCHLGFMYVEGKGSDANVDEGMRLLQESAEKKCSEAYNYLGIIYMTGLNMARNYPLAIQHFATAIDLGHLDAHVNLAQMHINGWGTSRTAWEAAKLLNRAADKGHARAQCYIGLMYRDGTGVNKNEKISKKWLEKSAVQGDSLGMYSYGKFLLEKEEDSDWVVIAEWLSKAAKQGNLEGETMESFYIDGLSKALDGFTLQ